MALAAMMLMMVFAVSCTKPDDSINSVSVSGTIELHDYVDLGLPSGTLWATCNVGADSPESYGDYYAWGEIYRKLDFYWENYKFGKYGRDKYNKSDSLLVLEAQDDVAQYRWYYGWCMPTKEQWEELVQNTTNIVTTLNGVEGRLFTASNGRNLFLPATGTGGISSVAPSFGFYWSSSLDDAYGPSPARSQAWLFYFDREDYYITSSLRCHGSTVRPVHPAE